MTYLEMDPLIKLTVAVKFAISSAAGRGDVELGNLLQVTETDRR